MNGNGFGDLLTALFQPQPEPQKQTARRLIDTWNNEHDGWHDDCCDCYEHGDCDEREDCD